MSSSLSSNRMTSAGRVAPIGEFAYAKVCSVVGGTTPEILISHGRHPGGAVIATVKAEIGAEIDLRSSPVRCPDGIYLDIAGSPRKIEVEVLFR